MVDDMRLQWSLNVVWLTNKYAKDSSRSSHSPHSSSSAINFQSQVSLTTPWLFDILGSASGGYKSQCLSGAPFGLQAGG